MIKNCEICKREFIVMPYLIKKGYGKYCCRKCWCISKKGKLPSCSFKKGHKFSKETIRKISEHSFQKGKTGKKCQHWKGGIYIHRGYKYIHSPHHPNKTKGNYVREHRLIMEKHLGRYLNPSEVIHHINGNPSDNRLENLILFKNNKIHIEYHRKFL